MYARHVRAVRRWRGLGMLEFLVALLVFTLGVSGLLAAQLEARRLVFEAQQRTQAIALARDLSGRIGVNADAAQAYTATDLGAVAMSAPPVDCLQHSCSGSELAAFDLWQFEDALRALPAGRACIDVHGAALRVVLNWRALSPGPGPGTALCALTPAGLYDARDAGAGNDRLRRQLVLSVFTGGGA
ncbi:MAG: type IV pilus modification protein PilV [Halioglobus sp.]|nr:type IV pilus modification protein PilV [Halioglobus sp.]